MNNYTVRDRKNYGNTDVAQVAYPKFIEKLTVCRDLLHGYDCFAFFGGNEFTARRTITGAVNFLLDRDREKDKKSYVKEALLLKHELSLCSSIAEEQEREEAALFEAVRVMIMRIQNQGGNKKLRLDEQLRQLLNESEAETFGKLKDAWTELSCLNECDCFINGFKLGVRLTVESLLPE